MCKSNNRMICICQVCSDVCLNQRARLRWTIYIFSITPTRTAASDTINRRARLRRTIERNLSYRWAVCIFSTTVIMTTITVISETFRYFLCSLTLIDASEHVRRLQKRDKQSPIELRHTTTPYLHPTHTTSPTPTQNHTLLYHTLDCTPTSHHMFSSTMGHERRSRHKHTHTNTHAHRSYR